MSNPAPVRAGEDAGREAIIEQIACCLAKQDGWTNPYAPWTDNVGSIARGQLGDPVWREYREDAEAVVDGQLADFFARASAAEAEIARLTQERDAAISVQEMCAMSGGFYARHSENATKRAEAAEFTVLALRERVARLEEALKPFAEEGFDDPHMLARDEKTLWWVGCDLTHGDFWRAMECFPARAALTEGAPTDV